MNSLPRIVHLRFPEGNIQEHLIADFRKLYEEGKAGDDDILYIKVDYGVFQATIRELKRCNGEGNPFTFDNLHNQGFPELGNSKVAKQNLVDFESSSDEDDVRLSSDNWPQQSCFDAWGIEPTNNLTNAQLQKTNANSSSTIPPAEKDLDALTYLAVSQKKDEPETKQGLLDEISTVSGAAPADFYKSLRRDATKVDCLMRMRQIQSKLKYHHTWIRMSSFPAELKKLSCFLCGDGPSWVFEEPIDLVEHIFSDAHIEKVCTVRFPKREIRCWEKVFRNASDVSTFAESLVKLVKNATTKSPSEKKTDAELKQQAKTTAKNLAAADPNFKETNKRTSVEQKSTKTVTNGPPSRFSTEFTEAAKQKAEASVDNCASDIATESGTASAEFQRALGRIRTNNPRVPLLDLARFQKNHMKKENCLTRMRALRVAFALYHQPWVQEGSFPTKLKKLRCFACGNSPGRVFTTPSELVEHVFSDAHIANVCAVGFADKEINCWEEIFRESNESTFGAALLELVESSTKKAEVFYIPLIHRTPAEVHAAKTPKERKIVENYREKLQAMKNEFAIIVSETWRMVQIPPTKRNLCNYCDEEVNVSSFIPIANHFFSLRHQNKLGAVTIFEHQFDFWQSRIWSPKILMPAKQVKKNKSKVAAAQNPPGSLATDRRQAVGQNKNKPGGINRRPPAATRNHRGTAEQQHKGADRQHNIMALKTTSATSTAQTPGASKSAKTIQQPAKCHQAETKLPSESANLSEEAAAAMLGELPVQVWPLQKVSGTANPEEFYEYPMSIAYHSYDP